MSFPNPKLAVFEIAASELSPADVADLKKHFVNNPMRGILALEFHRMIYEQTIGLETISPDKLPQTQGIIIGLRRALSALHQLK